MSPLAHGRGAPPPHEPRTRMGPAVLVTLAAGAFLAAPAQAEAQICLGNPAEPRGGALSGTAQFNGGPTSYGVDFNGNLDGPLSLGLGFMVTDLENVDEDIYTFGGSVAYDIAVETPGFGLCPVAGVEYSRWDDEIEDLEVEASRSEFRFPVGLGVGAELGDRESAAIVPALRAGWYYFTERESLEEDITNTEFARDDSGGEFFGEASAALVMGPFFVRGAVMTDHWRVDDPMYSVSVGLAF